MCGGYHLPGGIPQQFHSYVVVSVMLRSVTINHEEFLDRVNVDIARYHDILIISGTITINLEEFLDRSHSDVTRMGVCLARAGVVIVVLRQSLEVIEVKLVIDVVFANSQPLGCCELEDSN